MPAPDIFVRIRQALESDVPSSEISTTIAAINAEIEEQRHWRTEHEASIIDPLADSEAVVAADRSLAATHLTEKRLTEAARRLNAKLLEVQTAEVEADRRGRYDKARKIRDKAAAEIRAEWVKHATGLVRVVERIAAANAEVTSAYDKPPKGEPDLGSVVEGIRRPGTFTNSFVPFTDVVNLPEIHEWSAPGYTGKRYAGT